MNKSKSPMWGDWGGTVHSLGPAPPGDDLASLGVSRSGCLKAITSSGSVRLQVPAVCPLGVLNSPSSSSYQR